MKKLRFILLLLLALAAQTAQSRALLSADTSYLPRYDLKALGTNQVCLKMDYAGATILNPKAIAQLEGQYIERIELVYSYFPKNADLSKLAEKRLSALKKLLPSVFKQEEPINITFVLQTDCNSKAEAQALFHGFVVSCYPPVSPELRYRYETRELTKMAAGQVPFADSVVFRVLQRNQQWKKMLIVADLTGSMSPYIGQLLLWMKLNEKDPRAKHFVFFNDGNTTPDAKKVVGNTGGIYDISSTIFTEVITVAAKTIANGEGGDIEENNVEALLYGIKKFDDYDEIVMIADNFATPRDLKLVKDLNKPIRVILCGTHLGVNNQYIKLARKTGGSIHTMEDDLFKLVEVNEGQVIEIEGANYKLIKGNFVKLEEN